MNLFENLQLMKENQNSIDMFINTPIEELMDGKLIKIIYNEYSVDYKQLPNGLSNRNPSYDVIKGDFYNKWHSVAKKCKEIVKFISASNYDKDNLSFNDECYRIDNSFPYDWKEYSDMNKKSNVVSIKNYKRILNDIITIASNVSQKELISNQCGELIEDIYYKSVELKSMFTDTDDIETEV